jgi:hypothetical protein
MGEDVGATTGDVAELGIDSALQRCSRVRLLASRCHPGEEALSVEFAIAVIEHETCVVEELAAEGICWPISLHNETELAVHLGLCLLPWATILNTVAVAIVREALRKLRLKPARPVRVLHLPVGACCQAPSTAGCTAALTWASTALTDNRNPCAHQTAGLVPPCQTPQERKPEARSLPQNEARSLAWVSLNPKRGGVTCARACAGRCL